MEKINNFNNSNPYSENGKIIINEPETIILSLLEKVAYNKEIQNLAKNLGEKNL